MRIFGTDGVRGKANTELTPELALNLGRAAVSVLATGPRPVVFIGRDTRISCDMLAGALGAGLMSAGADVVDVGVVPTPALAYLTRISGAAFGAMISASHNPAIDNGIKFFTGTGYKLDDLSEDKIEAALTDHAACRVAGDEVGGWRVDHALQEEYLDYLLAKAPIELKGYKIVVDAANGAAFALAPELLKRAGAEVIPLHVTPDGRNINVKAGSTYPASLQARVIAEGADLGLALDGDGDRLIACDESGRIADGDDILHICASVLHADGQLPHATVVGTVMSNFGLDAVLRQRGIVLERAPVGDRYVLERMLNSGATLGGEQSGHCIFLDHSTTGDGLLTALMMLRALVRDRKPLGAWLGELVRFPQKLINVPVVDKHIAMGHQAVKEAIQRAQADLGGSGRILVRPSGTEQCVRVMVEAQDEEIAQRVAAAVAAAVKTISA